MVQNLLNQFLSKGISIYKSVVCIPAVNNSHGKAIFMENSTEHNTKNLIE